MGFSTHFFWVSVRTHETFHINDSNLPPSPPPRPFQDAFRIRLFLLCPKKFGPELYFFLGRGWGELATDNWWMDFPTATSWVSLSLSARRITAVAALKYTKLSERDAFMLIKKKKSVTSWVYSCYWRQFLTCLGTCDKSDEQSMCM